MVIGMGKKITALGLPPAINEEIEVLVESGEYTSRSDVLKDAFRIFFRKQAGKEDIYWHRDV